MQRESKQGHSWSVADTLTMVRIVASFGLLPLPVLSRLFFVLYALIGLTDVLDGWLARKTGTASAFGARLDSIADAIYIGILMLRLMPVLWKLLPPSIWYAVAAVVLVRLAACITSVIRHRRLVCLHTRMNKLTGVGVFLLPCALVLPVGVAYSWILCALALAAAWEEWMIHLCQSHVSADQASIWTQERKEKAS